MKNDLFSSGDDLLKEVLGRDPGYRWGRWKAWGQDDKQEMIRLLGVSVIKGELTKLGGLDRFRTVWLLLTSVLDGNADLVLQPDGFIRVHANSEQVIDGTLVDCALDGKDVAMIARQVGATRENLMAFAADLI